MRSAHDEAARGLIKFGVVVDEIRRDHLLDDQVDHGALYLLVLHVGRVLRGDDDGVDPLRLVVLVLDGHLRLGVGADELDLAGLARLRQAEHQLVRELYGHGHEIVGLGDGVAEHHPLVAGALFLVEALALGDSLRYVGGLGVHVHLHGAGLGIETDFRIVVADVLRHFPGHLLVVDLVRTISPETMILSVVQSVRRRRGSLSPAGACVEHGVEIWSLTCPMASEPIPSE